MLRRLLSAMVAVVACMVATAQGICVINGTIADCKLNDGKKVKSVTLTRTDESGREIEVATAKVKKGKYTFKCEVSKDEPVLMYEIRGFDEGTGIELFVEEGTVEVTTASAAQVCESRVGGTPTNDLYSGFKAILNNGYLEAEKYSDESLKSKEKVKTMSQAIRYLIDHNASPMTPLMIERWLLHMLTPTYADQMLKTIALPLHSHPYYLSLRNKVLAGNLKVGSEVPDIRLSLIGGETKHLSDFRGKYVVLNFWTDGCEKSAAMIEEVGNLYDIVKENQEQIVIVSVAIESDIAAWKAAVSSNGMERDGWLNACDGLGADSPAAKLLGVENAPRIIVVEPEGLAVTLDMDVDELIMRIEQILSGDLYYLDQKD